MEHFQSLTTDPDFSDNESALKCPNCEDTYLHQTEVLVFDRSEDNEQCTVTSVLNGRISSQAMPNELSGNPSSRRHAVVIRFVCEICGIGSSMDLRMSQHKGQTLVGWKWTTTDA